MNRSEKIMMVAVLALAALVFNIFNAAPPLPSEFPNLGGGGSGVRPDFSRLFTVVVERVEGDERRPVQSLLVRVGDLAAITNREGMAEFYLPAGVHRVVISSITSSLPTWTQDIEVRAVETTLRVRYHEYRQEISSLSVLADYVGRRSIVTVGYHPPPLNTTYFYSGNPVIHFMDQSLYLRAYKGEGVLDWFVASDMPYHGPFKTVIYNPGSEELVERVDVEGLVLYVSLAESYIPVFHVEAEVVEKM